MSYEVTATRRRPQRFEDLVGQEFVAATLKNSIQSGKIAHAYLFSGPRGCGKTSTARILAKALNCQTGPTPTPCGKCTACQEITKGSSLDVIEIDGASNTSVNDVRQIKDEVQFPPQSCRYKIYIIDEVHMLSTSAFNALLKTIEEPPPYVVFIFATTELQKVPATIKSRCQQFNFRLVPVEQVKTLLAQAAAEIGIQADDEALYWIARESTGSIRDAYTLFDQVAAFSDGHITYEKIRDKLGLVGVDRLNSLFEECAAGRNADAVLKLDEYLQSGISIEQLITNSADYLRSMLLLKNGVKKESLLGQALERYSEKVLTTWNSIQIERALSLFLQLYRDIRYSLSPRYEVELAFSRLCWLSQYISPAEVKAAVDSAGKLLSGSTVHTGILPPQNKVLPADVQSSSPAPSDAIQTQHTAEVQNTAPSQSIPEQSSEPVQPAMPGLPVFSALSGSTPEQGEVHPFSDGGALPPEKTADSAEHAAADSSIPAADTGGQEYPGPEVSDDAAPDDSGPDEGNPEEYSPDEDSGPVSDTDEQSSGQDIPPDVPNTEPVREDTPAAVYAVHQNEQTADIIKLRGKVIAELSVSDGFTASMLMQTGPWVQNGSAITTTVDSPFKKGQLDRQIPAITKILAQVSGMPLMLTVELKTQEQEQIHSAEIPPQVDILCKTFRGTIVGGKI